MSYFQLAFLRTVYLYYKMHLCNRYEVLKMPVSDISFSRLSFLCMKQIVTFALGVAVRQVQSNDTVRLETLPVTTCKCADLHTL